MNSEVVIKKLKSSFIEVTKSEVTQITFTNGEVFELLLNTEKKIAGKRAVLRRKNGDGWLTMGLSLHKYRVLASVVSHSTNDQYVYESLRKHCPININFNHINQKPESQCFVCARPWTHDDALTGRRYCNKHFQDMLATNNRHKHWERVREQFKNITGMDLHVLDYLMILDDIFIGKVSQLVKRGDKSSVHKVLVKDAYVHVEVTSKSSGAIINVLEIE